MQPGLRFAGIRLSGHKGAFQIRPLYSHIGQLTRTLLLFLPNDCQLLFKLRPPAAQFLKLRRRLFQFIAPELDLLLQLAGQLVLFFPQTRQFHQLLVALACHARHLFLDLPPVPL